MKRTYKFEIMKNFVIALILFLIPLFVIGQSKDDYDPKAKAILDEVSKKTKSYSAIKLKFSYTMENLKEDISDTQEGSLLLKGDKYILNIAGQKVICNGSTLWTYIEEASEVQISELEIDEGSIGPTTIFTIYEKGFKYTFYKEEVQKGKTMQLINLFPEKPDEKSYHTIRLYVDKAKKQLMKVKIFGKEGDNYIYKVEEMQTDVQVKDSDFTFNPADYPGVEVVDLR